MLNRRQVIKLYRESKSYAEVARQLGVSRQRIYQVMDTIKSSEVQAIRERRNRDHDAQCKVCNREFTGKLHHSRDNMCNACFTWSVRPTHRSPFRPLFYPNTCVECGVSTVGKHRSQGKCKRCYNKLYNTEHPEMRKIARKKYRAKNRLKLNAYQKSLRQKNHEHYLQYYRDYWKRRRDILKSIDKPQPIAYSRDRLTLNGSQKS